MSWNDTPSSERVAHIGKTIVDTPTHDRTISVFQKTYDRYLSRSEGTCSFVLGETRAGKTTACEEWMIRLAADVGGEVVSGDSVQSGVITSVVVHRDGGIERPVLKVQVDSNPTYKSLFADVVATVLGTRPPRSMTFQQLLGLLSHQLAAQKTRLLVFDDVQHIAEHRGRDGVYKAADVFKVLMKTARVQIALVGLPHAEEIQQANRQLFEMTVQTHLVRPFDLCLEPDGEYRLFLAALERDMPFDTQSDISSDDLGLRIHYHTGGYVGRISHLLIDAVEYAIEGNIGRVDRAVLAGLLRDYRGLPDSRNLFLLGDADLQGFPDRERAEAARGQRAAENRQTRKAGVQKRRRDMGVRGR